jgi:hypothetical protein
MEAALLLQGRICLVAALAAHVGTEMQALRPTRTLQDLLFLTLHATNHFF